MTIFCRQRFAFLPQMLIASFCFSILIDGFVGTGPVTRNQLHLKGQEWGKKKKKIDCYYYSPTLRPYPCVSIRNKSFTQVSELSHLPRWDGGWLFNIYADGDLWTKQGTRMKVEIWKKKISFSGASSEAKRRRRRRSGAMATVVEWNPIWHFPIQYV